MHPQNFTDLLKKVLLGQASPQEADALEKLTGRDENLAVLYREICLSGEALLSAAETGRAWCRHLRRMKKQKWL